MAAEQGLQWRWVAAAQRGARAALGMAIQVRVSDPTGTGMGLIFHSWVPPVPDPHSIGHGAGFNLYKRVTRGYPKLALAR